MIVSGLQQPAVDAAALAVDRDRVIGLVAERIGFVVGHPEGVLDVVEDPVEDVCQAAVAVVGKAHVPGPGVGFQNRYGRFIEQICRETLPNMMRLQACCHASQVEVVYTVIENLTLDGRDRSLDYRIAPRKDEITFPKLSSNVFVSTDALCAELAAA